MEIEENNRSADPIDIYVGRQIRTLRTALGITQQLLSEAIGVTYQQLQKYETAGNRISASRLYKLAEVLGVSPAWFFEGFTPDNLTAQPIELAPRSWLQLWADMSNLPPEVRKSYIEFGRSLAKHLDN